MTETKPRMHRAWLIFIGCCLVNLGGMGLFLNPVGNYFVPLANAFHLVNAETGAVDVTQVTLIMTAYSYVMLVWLPFCGQLFTKVDARILFSAGSICLIASCLLFNVWTEVWQIYISGALWGLAGPICFLVGPSVLINNWFEAKRAARYLGIASAFTGVGGVIFSPMVASIIGSSGYQMSFNVQAVLCAVLTLIPALFLFRTSPEEVGLQPYGIEQSPEGEAVAVKPCGVSGKYALGTVSFYLIFIAACLVSVGGGFKSLMPSAIASVSTTDVVMLGAWMTSAASVGNIIGKVACGTISSIIGAGKTFAAFCVLLFCGELLMIFFMGDNTVPMLAAGFLIGTSDALVAVGLPIIARECFGERCFAKIYSYVNMGVAILGGLGATFVAFVANFTGSFANAYMCGLVFAVIIGTCGFVAAKLAKKFRADWTEEGQPEAKRRKTA